MTTLEPTQPTTYYHRQHTHLHVGGVPGNGSPRLPNISRLSGGTPPCHIRTGLPRAGFGLAAFPDIAGKFLGISDSTHFHVSNKTKPNKYNPFSSDFSFPF